MKLIVNCETGQQTEIEITELDIKQQEIDETAWRIVEAEKAAKDAKKQEIFDKIGLTAEEVATIFS